MNKTKVYRNFDGKRYLLGFRKTSKKEAEKTAGYQRSIGRLARITEGQDGRWEIWVYGYYKTQLPRNKR